MDLALGKVVGGLKKEGEIRPGQLQMLKEVAGAIEENANIIIKAGTGTGKSFGYLIPALLSGKKVVVATATKNLQEQLVRNDLPAIVEALGLSVTYAILKGRSNYLCLKSLGERANAHYKGATLSDRLFEDQPGSVPVQDVYQKIYDWSLSTKSGDLAELDVEMTPEVAGTISVTSEECIGMRICPKGASCFAEKARRKATEADLVVINLHLLGLNIASNNKILPDFDVLVIDEAHELEDILTKTLGFSLTSRRLRKSIGELSNAFREIDASESYFFDAGYVSLPNKEDGDTIINTLTRLTDGFDYYLKRVLGRRLLPKTSDPEELELLNQIDLVKTNLYSGIQMLTDFISKSQAEFSVNTEDANTGMEIANAGETGGGEGSKPLYDQTRRALQVLGKLFKDISNVIDRGENLVVYVDGENYPQLEAMPLSLAEFLDGNLFDKGSTVMTSATIDQTISERLGLENTDIRFIEVESPFDYRANSLLYIPKHLPDPRAVGSEEKRYSEIVNLLTASFGKALVLFTSLAAMRAAFAFCQDKVSTKTIMQGQRPKSFLIEQFSAELDTSLFATMGFWQGIDVPGSSLSLVIIDKIPFSRPNDPLLVARRELAGEKAFMTIDLPRAANLLAQGVGRLIRTSTDRGLVAILDPRLTKAGYKDYLINSLPPMPITTDGSQALLYLRNLNGHNIND